MTERISRSVYVRNFSGKQTAGQRQKEALKQALDIRKFEIDLYWKRATYFWTFIAAAFAAYFVLHKDEPDVATIEAAYLVTCLGFVFSLAWYLINRGSKAWQRNWECHVDMLENEVMGPLYKTVFNTHAYRFWDLTDAYPYSPTKINQLVSLFVAAVWALLISKTLLTFDWSSAAKPIVQLLSAFTAGAALLLLQWGKSTPSGNSLSETVMTRRLPGIPGQ